jgi:sugar phosphate isomerase/epimerase
MTRPITLFTAQFTDLSLAEISEKAAAWGYDGLELACWGDHFDVGRVLDDPAYVKENKRILEANGLAVHTVSTHLVSQAVCDLVDERHKGVLSTAIWGDGETAGVQERAEEEVKRTARAAAAYGVDTVVGFTGSSIFHMFAGWPPVSEEMIDRGFDDFAERWNRIIDVFDTEGVKFAFEVHPGEIAFDFWSTKRALEAIGHREGFGINFDPSHLQWQGIDNVAFLDEFRDRIYHVHLKDTHVNLDGRNGILNSHLLDGNMRRAWDFVSLGHGDIPFEQIIRKLNEIGYTGPLSVEWEDNGMARELGAADALQVARKLDFEPAAAAWHSTFGDD